MLTPANRFMLLPNGITHASLSNSDAEKGLQSGDNKVTKNPLLSKLFHMSLTVHCLPQSRYSSM